MARLHFVTFLAVGLIACAEPQAKDLVLTSGIKGGLIVHVGRDPDFTADLRVNDSYLVHGLYPEGVAEARAKLTARGLYGKVSIDRFDGRSLPYADNLVNLIVVDDDIHVPKDEILRVLTPRGVAIVHGKRIIKPVPQDIDDWTHYLHGPDGNAVARDYRIAPPYHTQWEGGPRWQRSHDYLASLSALVSSDGRLFYIHDEGERSTIALPAKWFLVARDAFNGIILWKRSINLWESHFQRFRVGPAHLARRLVAVDGKVYVTMGYGEPVSVLDAATGRTLMKLAGTEGAHEIIVEGGKVYTTIIRKTTEEFKLEAQVSRGRLTGRTSESAKALSAKLKSLSSAASRDAAIVAVDAASGKLLWRRKDPAGDLLFNTLTAGGGRVFYQSSTTLFCLVASTGNVVWQAEREKNSYSGFQSPTIVLHKGVLLWAAKDSAHDPKKNKVKKEKGGQTKVGKPRITGKLIAYSVKDGKQLWSCPTAETFHAPFEIFVMEDLVWTGGVSSSTEPGLTEGRDYRTGKIVHTRPPSPELYEIAGHASCYRNKATERFLLMNRGGIDFIDVKEDKAYSNHYVRGTCQYGILPANGFVYATPHSCNCYISAKLSGYVATAGKRYDIPATPENRMEKGPAYNHTRRSRQADVQANWPTYRGDITRSGTVSSFPAASVKKDWELDLNGRLTPPVACGNLLYVADRSAHTLCAIAIDSGKTMWRYIAGGEIDSPPTIHDGLALFGAADGWVYALDAVTGQLAWRFHAAPCNQRIVSYGELKSAWPVPGNILVVNDCAYFVAGRSSYMDGGIFLYKLNAKTGERLAVHRIYDRDPGTDLEYAKVKDIRNLEGALPDILSSDGSSIFLRHRRFDLDLKQQPQDVPHLFSSAGFLDSDWWQRTFWQFGIKVRAGFGGWAATGNNTISGQLLSFDNSNFYGYGHHIYGNKVYYGLQYKYGYYRLFCMPRSNLELSRVKMLDDIPKDKRKELNKLKKKPFEFTWQTRINVLVRAMVLAGDKLIAAGPPDVISDEPMDAKLFNQDRVLTRLERQSDLFSGKGRGVLMIVSAKDGKPLFRDELQSPPVFNGMIVAGKRLVIADAKGRVVCYNAKVKK